jgi:hypothetical protein
MISTAFITPSSARILAPSAAHAPRQFILGQVQFAPALPDEIAKG